MCLSFLIDWYFFFLLSQLSVNTLQFLLFLYIQQIHRTSLRVSLIGEEWPTCRTAVSSSDRQAKTNSQNKVLANVKSLFFFTENSFWYVTVFCSLVQQNWDDRAHLSFIRSHLGEILDLLVAPSQRSPSGSLLEDCQVCELLKHIQLGCLFTY